MAQVAVDVWTADNGLPQNIVRSICQTPDGYLWLATFDGLVRFDGVRFTTFNRSNTAGISGNRFGSLFCSADGDFWAGTEGTGITQYHRGRFTTYTVQDGLLSNNIVGISSDGRGNVWVLAGGYATRWSPTDHRFIPQNRDEYKYALTPDGRLGFWRLDGSGLYVFSHGEQSRYALPKGWHLTAGASAGSDLGEHIWLADGRGRLAELVDGRWISTWRRRHSTPAHHEEDTGSPDYRDSQGNRWRCEIAWHSGVGLVRYLDLTAGTRPARIAFNTLFEDREGNIWLSTDGQGLYRIGTQTIKVFSKEQGLPESNVYPVCLGRDDSIWVGTFTGGLCRIKDGKFTTYTMLNGLASNRVNAIAEDRQGVLWVAVEHALHRLRNGRFESVRYNGVIPGDRVIRAIDQDPDGVMWFGTGEGLIRLEKEQWRELTKRDGLATDDVRVIVNGRHGNLWVGGYGGLSSLRNGQAQAWTEKDGLPSDTVRALYEDANGVLWIGTYDGGLGRFENGKFTRYTVREGLFNNGVFQIFEDSRNNLWMSCNQGIYRVNKKQLNDFAAGRRKNITSISYGKRDGLRNIECNGGLWPAGCKTRDGRLWFPTQDGVAVIDPEKLAIIDRKPPPVVIESLLIDEAPTPIDRPVRVTPGHDSYEFQYTALSLTNSERVRFRYKMQGVDRDWVDAGTRRTAYYYHLPAGKYTFKVIAAHSDGVWNEAGASFAIVVLPSFYQTAWFIFFCSATAISLLWTAWRYRLSQLERSRAAQQTFSRQLIASEERLRKRLAAELHDSLGQRLVIIQNLALILLQNRNASGLIAGERERVEEISTEVSEAVREVKEISYSLRPYRLDRLGLTVAVRSMIEAAATASSIAFFAEIDDIDGVLPKEAEINFYRIVQECINNILKHSEAGHASVRIERTKERLVLTVRDQGKGFEQGSAQANPSGGFGLAGISERAQLLGGKAVIHSAPGQGTTVNIEIHSETES